MFIRGKPIKFGYKIWALCASNGFPYCLQLYEGKKENNNQPLGSQVVNTLLDAVEDCRQHTVYFDNFFTSYDLLLSLKERNMRATGTVRDNRTAKCPLQTENEIKKLAKGSHDNRSDGNVLFCRWKDNAVVTIGSNFEAVTPLGKAKRWSKKERKYVIVPQPAMFQNYNARMGGVDILDKLLGSYRPRLRSKKWYWNLFSNALNVAIVAAYRISQEAYKDQRYTHLKYRRDLAAALLGGVLRCRSGGPTFTPCLELKLQSGHFQEPADFQGRCVYCGRNTTKMCGKCGKRLHGKCMELYHKDKREKCICVRKAVFLCV